MRLLWCVISAIALSSFGLTTSAQMVYSSQTRTATATGPGGTLQTQSAQNFGDVQLDVTGFIARRRRHDQHVRIAAMDQPQGADQKRLRLDRDHARAEPAER